jgi:hypothetical protein
MPTAASDARNTEPKNSALNGSMGQGQASSAASDRKNNPPPAASSTATSSQVTPRSSGGMGGLGS